MSARKTSKRKTSKSASKDVEVGDTAGVKVARSKAGKAEKKVTSKKQAIAIGLSEARKKGKKVARKKSS